MPFYYDGELVSGPQGPAGPDGNPVGTVISFMGTSAPKDYLVCDGAEYSVKDYPTLAEFFRKQFGAVNHFGGDGTTAFAVPDMRNLFLRGYHGEAEEQLSGEIGKRQEATAFSNVYSADYNNAIYAVSASDEPSTFAYRNADSLEEYGDVVTAVRGSIVPVSDIVRYYTSRPVNMAVLYCIKAVESASGGVEEYDTENGWHVRKWSDGYIEMIYKASHTGTSIAFGSGSILAFDSISSSFQFPVVLKEKYSENFSLLASNNTGNAKYATIYELGDLTKTNSWVLYVAKSPSVISADFSIAVTGRWK